jgi:hypothetical protein
MVIALGAAVLHQQVAAQACGDKFLMVGRGARFHRAYAAIYPASIVIYSQAQRHAARAIRDPRLRADLKLAGHRVSLVEDDGALAQALAADRVDIVLTDAEDADRTSRQAAVASSKPAVLPVMYEPTGEEAREIEARYQCRLKGSDRVDRYLAAIDDAMKARVNQRKARNP